MLKRFILGITVGVLTAELRADDVNFLGMFDLTYFDIYTQQEEKASNPTKSERSQLNELIALLKMSADDQINPQVKAQADFQELLNAIHNILFKADLGDSNTFIDKIQNKNPWAKNVLNIQRGNLAELIRKHFIYWKNSIEDAIRQVKRTRLGKELLDRIKGLLRPGEKIKIKLGENSHFEHPTRGEPPVIVVNLTFKPKSTLFIKGVESKDRDLDVTIFHELLHGYHFLAEREEDGATPQYFLGIKSDNINDQCVVAKSILKEFFGITFEDKSLKWMKENMSPWISQDNFKRDYFLVEELRTLFGDPGSDKEYYQMTEFEYLVDTERLGDIRIGYTDKNYSNVFWHEAVGAPAIFEYLERIIDNRRR